MFAVVWADQALDELADIWVAATPELRDRIEASVRRLGQRLQADPTAIGESRSNNRRVAFDPPIAIIYRIDTAGRSVEVTHVWRYGK
jgi:plasmid stabilization system protein ParE